MKILVGTLFIALVVFPHSVELSGRPGISYPPYERNTASSRDKGSVRTGGLFYEDQNGKLQPLPASASLFEYKKFFIGRLSGDKILPLLNESGRVVFKEIHHPNRNEVVGPTAAKRFGIPGTVVEVLAAIDRIHEAENERIRAASQRFQNNGSQRQN